MVEPVEERDDEARLGVDALQRSGECRGLGRDDQHVDGVLEALDRAGTDAEVAQADALYAQPVALDRGRGGFPRDDGHGRARACEGCGQEAAHAARAEDRVAVHARRGG